MRRVREPHLARRALVQLRGHGEADRTGARFVAAEQAGRGNVVLFQPPMRPDGARKLADAVAGTCGGLAAVFAGPEGGRFQYALVRADGADIAPLVKELNAALSGRGGGRGGFAQGSVQAERAQIEAFFAGRS